MDAPAGPPPGPLPDEPAGDVAQPLVTRAGPGAPDGSGWSVRATRYLFRSRWYALRQDELRLRGGHELTYTFVEHPGYAMVVPVFDDGQVLMERLWRHTLQCTTLCCPSGGLEGQRPDVAARRELEEETGYRARELLPLGTFFGSAGISSERFHLYLATGLSADGQLAREPAEDMDLVRLPLAELHAAVLAGELPDAPSALGILLASAHRTRAAHRSPP